MSDSTKILDISDGGGALSRRKHKRRSRAIQNEQSTPLVNSNVNSFDPRADLKQKLRDKIHSRSMERITVRVRNDILEKSLKTMGIDQDKLRSDLEAVNKMGGFTIDMKK